MRTGYLALALVVPAIAAAPAHAAKPANGVYKGTTSQDLAVKLTVRKGSFAKFAVHVKNSCGATDKTIAVTGPIPVKKSGRFAASLGDGELVFKGRFKGSTVKGKVRQNYEDSLLGTCDTGIVSFRAKR